MRKRNKGFTLVELLVVITILAVLATVSILGYAAFTKKANISNDQAVVSQMNIALKSNEALGDKARYCHQAVQQCIEAGFILENLTPSTAKYNFAYDQANNRFMLLDENYEFNYGEENHSTDKYRIHVVVGSDKELYDANKKEYSTYLRVNFKYKDNTKTITTNKGIDVGNNVDISVINYDNTENNPIIQEVVIRTATFGTKLIVNGYVDSADKTIGDVVTHFGFAGIVDVKKVATASYDENGVVGRAIIQEGHFEAKDGCEIFCLMDERSDTEKANDETDNSSEPTVEEGAIVHANMVNINAAEGIEKDETTGLANGHVDDCGPGRHTFSQYVVDTQHVYDVCTCCGYTLIHVKDTNGTEIKQTQNTLVLEEEGKGTGENGERRYVVSSDVQGNIDDVIIPVETYYTANTIPTKTNGEEIVVNVEKLQKDNLEISETPIEPTPVVDPEEPINPTCQHSFTIYVSNNDGTHNVKCSKCSTSYNENCNTNGTNGTCSICGYKDDTKYLVTLDKQNGSGGSDNVYVANGKSMPAILLPKRVGYTFAGYYSATNGGGTKYYNADGTSAKSYDLTGATTLYAKWTVGTYNIKYFDQNGYEFSGTHGTSYPKTHNYDVETILVSPTKVGYKFDGWYLESNCSGSVVTSLAANTYTADIKLYAKWTVNTYNITYYDMGGATFSGEYVNLNGKTVPTTYTYTEATELFNPISKYHTAQTPTHLPNPHAINTFYDFAGWYTDSDCSDDKKVTSLAANTYTADIKLYAKWTPKDYTIVYHDKGSNNSLSVALTGLPTTHTYGIETTLPNPVEREGWVFLGWYTDYDCKTSKITSLEALSDYVDYVGYPYECNKIHLYAKWAYLHKITLKNGDTIMGTVVYQPEDEPMVKLTSAQIPTSTKTGYTFDGYYSAPYGGGTKYYNSDGTSASDFLYYSHAPGQNTNHTLYARFKPIEYTITYNLNGGEHGANYPTKHTYDTATTLVSPTKPGYTFMGWYTDADFSGTALTSLSATGYTKNITLNAKWAKASAWKPLNTGGKLYYPVLGGSNPQPTKFAYSTDGENFTEITKPDGGYTMSGDVAKYAALGQLYYQGGSVTVARISAYDGKDDGEAICVIRDSSGCIDDIEPSINGITIEKICDSYDEDKYNCLTCIYWEEEYWVYYSCYSWDWNENGPGNLKYVIYRTFN